MIDGVLYMSVGLLDAEGDQEPNMVDHPMYFCPFCGTKLQTEAEVEAKSGGIRLSTPHQQVNGQNDGRHVQVRARDVPSAWLLSQDASQVIVPGVEGEFTVLPGHAPVISALRPGVVDATLGDARKSACS